MFITVLKLKRILTVRSDYIRYWPKSCTAEQGQLN